MIDGSELEAASATFARRFGERLREARRSAHRPLWWQARRTGGRFNVRDLADAEVGLLALDPETVDELAQAYRIDLGTVLPATRRGLTIGDGVVSAGGVTVPYTPGDPAALVRAYFRLTRTLRAVEDDAKVRLRRDDVQRIAQYVEEHMPRADVADASLRSVLDVVEGDRRVMVAAVRAGAECIGLLDDDED